MTKLKLFKYNEAILTYILSIIIIHKIDVTTNRKCKLANCTCLKGRQLAWNRGLLEEDEWQAFEWEPVIICIGYRQVPGMRLFE